MVLVSLGTFFLDRNRGLQRGPQLYLSVRFMLKSTFKHFSSLCAIVKNRVQTYLRDDVYIHSSFPDTCMSALRMSTARDCGRQVLISCAGSWAPDAHRAYRAHAKFHFLRAEIRGRLNLSGCSRILVWGGGFLEMIPLLQRLLL